MGAVPKQAVQIVLRQGKTDIVTEINLTVFTENVVVATVLGNEIAIRKSVQECLLGPAGTTQAGDVFAGNGLERALEFGAAPIVP